MRVIIAGSRGVTNYDLVKEAVIESGFTISAIVSGGARGVDELGERYANEYGIELQRFPAMWKELGRAAGYHRNVAMAKNADALIAIWDGISPGTQHMIKIASNFDLPTYIHRVG